MALSNQIEGKGSHLEFTSPHFRKLETNWEKYKRKTAKTFEDQSFKVQPVESQEKHPFKKALQRVVTIATIMVS